MGQATVAMEVGKVGKMVVVVVETVAGFEEG
jgi:hypothetical protein